MFEPICLCRLYPRLSIPVPTLIRLLPIWCWLCAWPALAIEVCELPPRYGSSPAAQAIVRTACEEHRLWQQPFIDRQGRIASLSVTEAESDTLVNQELIALATRSTLLA